MSHDVFISYSTKDKLTADAVCATLEGRGIRCWIAPRDIVPGQDWSDAIIDGLTATRVFILLLSETSNNSEQVKREVQNAVSEGMAIVPFRIEDVALSKHMRYFIGTPHWLDALTPPLEAHLERLAHTIHALLKATEQDETDEILLPKDVQAPSHQPKAVPMGETGWSPEVLIKVERELATHIGPMARVLVHKAALRITELNELCQHVSQYIPSEKEKERFLKATRCESVSKSSAANPASLPSGPPKTWDPGLLQNIERQFAVYIGPLSRILVKRASQRAETLDDLYRLLAEHLTSASDKDKFLRGQIAA